MKAVQEARFGGPEILGSSYPLGQARVAHEDLLGRRHIGKIVLEVSK